MDNSKLKKLSARALDANKYDFGPVFIFAGHKGMPGAARLCAEGCLRAGAGMVILATHPAHADAIAMSRPEMICHGIEEMHQLSALVKKAKVLAVGPGLTQDHWCVEGVEMLLQQTHLPMVIDAGALAIIKPKIGKHPQWILTPHVGEAAILLDLTPQQVQRDKVAAAQELQKRYGAVVVLKGAKTLVVSQQSVETVQAGNPGMASAGMGDVLTGVIAGLVAQDIDLNEAAYLGATLHAMAGDECAKREGLLGMLALDLLPYLRNKINKL